MRSQSFLPGGSAEICRPRGRGRPVRLRRRLSEAARQAVSSAVPRALARVRRARARSVQRQNGWQRQSERDRDGPGAQGSSPSDADARAKTRAIARGVVHRTRRSRSCGERQIQEWESGELSYHVGGIQDRFLPVAQQRVRSGVRFLQRMARHDEDLSACRERQRAVISAPECLAASTTTTTRASPAMIRLRRGNDQRPTGIPSPCSPAMQPLRGRSSPRDAGSMADRHIETARENGDRRAAYLERASMRGSVDADRTSADDRDPGRRQPGPQPLAHLQSEGCRLAGPDDRRRRRGEERRIAPHPQRRRGSSISLRSSGYHGSSRRISRERVRSAVQDGYHRGAFPGPASRDR